METAQPSALIFVHVEIVSPTYCVDGVTMDPILEKVPAYMGSSATETTTSSKPILAAWL